VQVAVDSETPPLLAVPGQLQQVLVNLITNACHAMPEGAGRLVISAGTTADGDVEIQITDNGSGIPDDHLAHIFEPFFSTKGEGQGTGLGLSIVRNIVELHNGVIAVESALGQGTTFRLTFPAQGLRATAP
jgi:signal transduction histidine kinase